MRKYVEVISSFLRREFASFLDQIPELRLSSLELAGFVGGCYPVCDFAFCLLLVSPSSRPVHSRRRHTIFATLLEKKAFDVGFGKRLSLEERVKVLKSIKDLRWNCCCFMREEVLDAVIRARCLSRLHAGA
jgi:hypothetical protein